MARLHAVSRDEAAAPIVLTMYGYLLGDRDPVATALHLKHAVTSRALRTEFDDVDERVVEVAAPEGNEALDPGLSISASKEA